MSATVTAAPDLPPHESSGEHTVPAASPQTQSAQDPRIDRFITWVLGTVFTIALTACVWFLNGLTSSMAEMRKELVDLRLEVKGKETDRKDIDELKKELLDLRRDFVTFQLSQKR